MRHIRQPNERLSSRSPEFLLHVAKSSLASLRWKLWSMYAYDSVKGSMLDSSYHDTVLEFNAIVLANLGSRLRQPPSKDCALCNLLSSIRIPPSINATRSQADVLIAFPYFDAFWDLDGSSKRERWDYGGTPSDIVIIGAIHEDDQSKARHIEDFGQLMQKAKPRGFLTCRLSDCESDVSRSVPAQQPTINFGDISRAIQTCEKSHYECQKYKPLSAQPVEISLIDCYTRKLVLAKSTETYVALSYVWGGVSASSLDSSTPLPRTLADAIQVTQDLGFRYLWIDQFCVNQHDRATRHKQIRSMGRVYESAIVTLVAASGSDANVGLPGAMGRPQEKPRPPIVIDGCIISEEAAPIDLEVQDSVWASRGWTFQEQYFSQRFLVFGAGQMSFECRRAKYSSRFGIHDYGSRTVSTKPLPAWFSLYSRLHARNHQTWNHTREKYEHLVNEYWPRQLSYKEDGINAFAATLDQLQALWNAELFETARVKGPDTHERRMTFTAGIPHLLRHQTVSPEPSTRMFAYGLSWYSQSSSQRRENFPSWCWAGWTPLQKTQSKHSMLWHFGDADWMPLIQDVFFMSCPDPEMYGVSWPEPNTPERVPIAEHEFFSVPEAVIFNAPPVHHRAISRIEKDKLLLWGCEAQWFLGNRSLLYQFGFLEDFMSGKYCMIALRHQKRRDECPGRVVFLLVQRADHKRHERIGLVYANMYKKVKHQEFYENLELRSWELI